MDIAEKGRYSVKRTLHHAHASALARMPSPAKHGDRTPTATRSWGKRWASAGLAVLLITATTAVSAGASAPIDNTATTSAAVAAETAAVTAPTPTTARARPSYPWPSGAMAVTLYKDGQRILPGEVADIGGTIYVPVQKFVALFGSFGGAYEEWAERVTYTGKNLKVIIKVGDPYITVNDRIFYTGKPVLSLGGWIFAPIESMTRAMGSTVSIQKGWYQASITSGDPAAVPHASEVYNEEDLYWLSRIISAESRGEPLQGRIAVGNVVLNRTRSPAYPDTVKGVVFDRKYGTQFAPVANGTIYNAPTAGATLAAKICLEGYSISPRALYFFNPAATSAAWIVANRPYLFTIANHKFYG